jgi:hypothetical protein
MFFILALAPFLTLISTFLVLSYTGRHFREKITIFFFNPVDAGSSSQGTLFLFRVGFWVSLLISVGIVVGMLSQAA